MDNSQEKTPTAMWEYTAGSASPAEAANIRWVLLPLLATLGGAWAFKESTDPYFSPTLLTKLALILGGWAPLWLTMTRTNWAYALQKWHVWTEAETLPPWPYLQPGTMGSHLHERLGQARAWWKKVGQPAFSGPLTQILFALTVSVLLGFIIGRTALLLTMLTITCTQLAILWSAGNQARGTGWLALTQVGLPWMLGASLESQLPTRALLPGFALVILTGFITLNSPVALIGPAVAAVFLVWTGHPLTGGWVLLLCVPVVMKLAQHPALPEYHKTVLPWLLVMLGLIATVI